MPKPPFRPQAAGTIGFFFSIVAGALVSIISLRRMGHSQKAKKVLWLTLLGAATILILIPAALGRFVGLGLEGVWYFVFPKIQDQEFRQWQATHPDVAPSSGWKALGWGFVGIVAFFAIAMAMGIFLDATGIAPQ